MKKKVLDAIKRFHVTREVLSLKRAQIRRKIFGTKDFIKSLSRAYRTESFSFSIVSACFNVESYVDEFVSSVLKQSVKVDLQLILVDDGSTDQTLSKLLSWQDRYPEIIRVLHKENGGQASARNYGLSYVKNEWVSFVDPDDTLDYFCFYAICDFLKKNKSSDISLICMNIIPFYEERLKFINGHPLRYKFTNKACVKKAKVMGDFIQLSSASCFFRSNLLKGNYLFPEDVKPNFEDAFLISSFLLDNSETKVAFLKNAIYFYRKRSAKNSTLDLSAKDKRRYIDVLENGHLRLIDKCLGKVPVFLQNVFVYDLYWQIKAIVNNDEKVSFLTREEQERFVRNVKKIYSFISPEVVWGFRSAIINDYHKTGMLSCFKGECPFMNGVYVKKYLKNTKEILFEYFAKEIKEEKISVNGVELTALESKTITHKFLSEDFLKVRRVWVSLKDFDEDALISFSLNGKNVPIIISNEKFEICSLYRIKESFIWGGEKATPKYKDCWLIADRDIQADDNGEHLYRYIKDNHPEIKIFFLLRRESSDWNRLESEGFNLLAFGSKEHKKALLSCSKLISSHIDAYLVNAFGTHADTHVPFVFLQHGVIKDNLSGWLNSKPLSMFVVSTNPEFNSIVSEGSPYVFTKKEVKLTGLPRHDSLLRKNNPEKIILIMPTWRKYLVGDCLPGSCAHERIAGISNTEYVKSWQSVLSSPVLKELCEKYQYKVIFYLHAMMSIYGDVFNIPPYMAYASAKDIGIQELFAKSKLMITDYSSVAFEMGYLEKPVLYYQFDRETFFSGGHAYREGYFSYERDGFGPVSYSEDKLMKDLSEILQNEGKPSAQYLDRMHDTFLFRDGKCCERVFNEIKKLDSLA